MVKVWTWWPRLAHGEVEVDPGLVVVAAEDDPTAVEVARQDVDGVGVAGQGRPSDAHRRVPGTDGGESVTGPLGDEDVPFITFQVGHAHRGPGVALGITGPAPLGGVVDEGSTLESLDDAVEVVERNDQAGRSAVRRGQVLEVEVAVVVAQADEVPEVLVDAEPGPGVLGGRAALVEGVGCLDVAADGLQVVVARGGLGSDRRGGRPIAGLHVEQVRHVQAQGGDHGLDAAPCSAVEEEAPRGLQGQ